MALTGGMTAAPTAVADEGDTFAIVGNLQSELGCTGGDNGGDWLPDCAATELAPTDTPGLYASEFELPAGSYEYKVTANDSWDQSWGLNGGGDNIPLAIDGTATLRFMFDDNEDKVGLEVVSVRDGYTSADDALVAAPVRQPGSEQQFYFVMTDRFANADTSNDEGGLTGDRLVTGFDPTDKGFFNGGDIAGLRGNLDYIEGLGTTAIWLTPSFKNRPVQGTGTDASAGYHGYWVTDFTQIDPHLGTNAELQALISEAHDRGIKVYFDIITNHTADLISYEEGNYSYVDQATSPYLDASGNEFDPAEYAGTGSFPALDAQTSFPYTPVVAAGDEDLKVPAWLNDPTLYHNRGDSTWSGESVTYGDFAGLDDLMTEHPDVVSGFVEVYQDWVDIGIDGFRIDTAKHVNFEFWEQWTDEVLTYARDNGKPDFFMFGEVYDADPAKLAPYVRDTDMSSVLDFTFQSAAVSYASGNSARGLQNLYAGDDRYTTPDSSSTALPTFLGNHDMGRVGYFLQNQPQGLERDLLAHDLMFLGRGQPVVYYGDEQGFAGVGAGNDKDSRQSLFATQVDEYENQQLITGETLGATDHFATDAPIYRHIADLAQLRADHPALVTGAQIERYADNGAGVYAFSRVDRDEKTEYLVALNNTTAAKTVDLATLTADATFSSVYGGGTDFSTGADASASITVPALTAVVWKAGSTVTAPAEPLVVTVSAPAAGAGLADETPVSADVDDATWQETSFAWRVVGSDQWHALGTAEDTEPRVFDDLDAGLATGTLVEYRAVTTDAAGRHAAASTYASIGNAVSLDVEEEPGGDISMVTVPGNLNQAMGCATPWEPSCEAAKLTLDPTSGVWVGTFDLPAGNYEYKVAINGSWDINYGANGVPGGPNLAFSHGGGPITFYFDPRTNIVQSTAEGPIVTIPGNQQDELGCSGDWKPECLVTLMADGDRDGVYEFTTDQLPAGSYEVKVAHGLGWDENYGEGGAPGGANIGFTVGDGDHLVFRYTLSTHVLTIESDNPPLAGVGQLRAYWVDETTLAWPAGLGTDAADAAWQLYGSSEATLAVEDDDVVGGDPATLTRIAGGLTDEQKQRFPALADYVALGLDDTGRDEVAALLTGQLMVAQRDAEGALTGLTGVQISGVLDDLYASAVADVDLGVTFDNRKVPTFRLWAPTAQQASLLTWDEDARDQDPVRHDATWDAATGTWTVKAGKSLRLDDYLWEVVVYAPTTGAVETNQVTDPYSVALTTNSERSVAVDLDARNLQPAQWRKAVAPTIDKPVDRAIYELHIRDFSVTDETVPEEQRGTYRAFTRKSAGTKQLRQLADAGINTVHLLPSFDIATIEEDRSKQAVPDCDLESYAPDSTEQQACVEAVADTDGFNWGYDPYHYSVPEGSYAVDPDGGARVKEFREMVGALHGMGLQVVLDEVFNHTAQSGQGDKSVLDQVVPGYYHRLNAAGAVETSTCCQNVATEHQVAQKLMVDSVVLWAKEYKVDGFRFDLMGHHSKENMLAIRAALDELTLRKDGVDGSKIYLYGEGWNFGEVANNSLFYQAVQGQLGDTGIGTFSDRLRDAVHGGSPVNGASTFYQGFGTGLFTDPNGRDGVPGDAEADLAAKTDLVKLGLAGNLRDFELTTADGSTKSGDELDYGGSPAGYADEPDEVITYVDAHDNETLYDLAVLKLPVDTSMADRVRMNTVMLATTTWAQTPSFWHAGTELLRSKSLDRNSYNSGDWFNRIDWTGQESTFGSGLPRAADNEDKWPIMAPLLADPDLKPGADDIAAAESAALDLLRVRDDVGLLRLGSSDLIKEKVSFPGSGSGEAPGVITMLVDDTVGEDADEDLDAALVAFNASPDPVTVTLSDLSGREFELADALADGKDPVVKTTTWDSSDGTIVIPARSAVVLVDEAPDDDVGWPFGRDWGRNWRWLWDGLFG